MSDWNFALDVIKTKNWSKVNVEKGIRPVISKLKPRFENIMKHKYAYAHSTNKILINFFIDIVSTKHVI